MTTAAQQAAYLVARDIANASGAAPGLDAWWAIVKREEAAALAADVGSADAGADKPADDRDALGEAGAWAAYTRDYFGARRWSRAHYFASELAQVAICERDPRGGVEWIAETDEPRIPGRCAHCVRLSTHSPN